MNVINKAKLIYKIEGLYNQLLDHEYEAWYSSNTTTSWEDSFSCKKCDKLHTEKQELINQIERSF